MIKFADKLSSLFNFQKKGIDFKRMEKYWESI